MDQNKVTCLILLDLSAAFDTVNHELLLNYLRYRYGVTGQALEWIHSYLTGRTQKVVIGDPSSGAAESEKAQLTQGFHRAQFWVLPYSHYMSHHLATFVEITALTFTAKQMINKITVHSVLRCLTVRIYVLVNLNPTLVM